ncbi:cadherin-like protein 26 isoform X1 [Tachysurus fulvidraco]|uniref:cadherin-like protein 26 isoform X1 n=1 Tax=Tachysurus fulvidraco TaxID=1234273 RepID=UPI001FEECE57|nr:cadherin-like protein 26 isoform X1 [Tachysurus fulvidraco]
MRTIITTLIILSVACVVEVSGKSKIRQKRTWIIDSFVIEEENPGPFPYVLGTIHVENDKSVWFFLTGMGIEKEPKNVLSINTRTGELLVHKKVDYETYKSLSLIFEERDEKFALNTKLGVEIKILDINDHAPVFNSSLYEETLDESVTQGNLVATVYASDLDEPNTPNSTFKFAIVSVTPETDNVQFYIKQNNNIGSIYFKGCLDYQKAQKYTLLIKATDNGNKVQLSNTSTVVLNIIDNNNNHPYITGHTGPAKIKEREVGVVLRLQVNDSDSNGSPAWKAKFTLHGDLENYFNITTDPKTNEGILTVVKAMDYEKQSARNLSISVENEVPYFFCGVKKRKLSDLWDVETRLKEFSVPYNITINVEDVNDPPEFVLPIKKIWMKENIKIGTVLETFSVIDPDKTFDNTFYFKKGEDKNNWVTVESETGRVLVNNVMDRESAILKDSTYTVIVYAVNKAENPQTGTGTLLIHLMDENDNVPLLVRNTVEMCVSNKTTNIYAADPDLPPYSAPFHWLLEDDQTKEKWKIEPNFGTNVSLVKKDTVYSGNYVIRIKISDSQGHGSVQNLYVKVHFCTSNHLTVQLGLSAVRIIIFTLLILLVTFLMALKLSKKRKTAMILSDDVSGNLMISNTEMPGTDCEVPNHISQLLLNGRSVKMTNGSSRKHSLLHDSTSATSAENLMLGKSPCRVSMSTNFTNHRDHTHISRVLSNQIDQKLVQLQTSEHELGDYKPHSYADEGPEEIHDENLDTLSVTENDFNPDILTNLSVRFSSLAAVCRADLKSPPQG